MKLQGGRIIKKKEDRWKCDMMTHKKNLISLTSLFIIDHTLMCRGLHTNSQQLSNKHLVTQSVKSPRDTCMPHTPEVDFSF